MARVKTQYKCRSCGYISASYLGRCPNCGAWNQFEKETEEVQKRSTKATASRLIQKTGLYVPVGNIHIGNCSRIAAGSGVLADVPACKTVAGVPARIVGEAGCSQPAITMDQRLKDCDCTDL